MKRDWRLEEDEDGMCCRLRYDVIGYIVAERDRCFYSIHRMMYRA